MSVTVIAELSINHGGNTDVAMDMIRAAKECGCDAVKVQAYDVRDFLPEGHKDWEMFAWAQLDRDAILTLCRYAHDIGVKFGATPTNTEMVAFLKDIGVDFLKNGSDFLLRHDLIEAMLATGLPTWVSTGMATEKELWDLAGRYDLMLCTSLYPCPDEEVNMVRLETGRYKGFSDHTTHGSVAAVMAVAHGVEMIERHFCLSRASEAPDAKWSLNPGEMGMYVEDIRRAEKMIGEAVYPSPAEWWGRDHWRVKEGELRRG